MTHTIHPRSPREVMAGWTYLPRFVDKIRLHLAGKLHPDYQENFTNGFDGVWLKAAGLSADQFIAVVKNSNTILNRGKDSDDTRQRLKLRKEEAGFSRRDDIQSFVDFIDADEKRI